MRLNPDFGAFYSSDNLDPQLVAEGEQRLYAFLMHSEAASKLSDSDLIQQVIQKVVDQLGIGNQSDALIMELIERFEKAKGIEDEEIVT